MTSVHFVARARAGQNLFSSVHLIARCPVGHFRSEREVESSNRKKMSKYGTFRDLEKDKLHLQIMLLVFVVIAT